MQGTFNRFCAKCGTLLEPGNGTICTNCERIDVQHKLQSKLVAQENAARLRVLGAWFFKILLFVVGGLTVLYGFHLLPQSWQDVLSGVGIMLFGISIITQGTK